MFAGIIRTTRKWKVAGSVTYPLGIFRVQAMACLFILLLGGIALAQTTSASAKVVSPGGYEALVKKLAKQETVRLIVKLNVEFQPVGDVASTESVQQIERIASVQGELLANLGESAPRSVHKYSYIPYVFMEVDASTLQKLLTSPLTVNIQEDIPEPPALNLSVPRIGANLVQADGYKGTGVVTAVLDTGVEKTHPFLVGSVVSEACYSTIDAGYLATSVCPGGVTESTATGSAMPYAGNCPSGECDHGTHVAGIVAGRAGVSGAPGPGVAPEAGIIAIQVFTRFEEECGYPCALSFPSDQMRGLERVYALRSTYNISSVNMSLGGGQYYSTSECDTDARKAIIDNLKAAGIATVISTGNSGYCGSMGKPGCISSAVSIGATTDSDTVANYSNSATFQSLLAPGSSINSSVPGGSFASWDGTSMAAPHVTGAWALLKQAKPTATVSQILAAFTSTGLSVTDSKCTSVTKKRINVDEAFNALGGPVTSVTLTPSLTSPRPIGTSITFTAAATGGTGTTRYQFWLRNTTGSWTTVRAYSSTPTWTWNTTGLPSGDYLIQVWAKNAGCTKTYEAYKNATYTITGGPVSSVNLTPNLSSPRTAGTSIVFTAAASGGSASYQYKFWLKNTAGTWTMVRDYSASPTWTWNSSLPAGNYQVQVWARNTGSSASYEAYRNLSYTLTVPPASSVTLTPNLSSPRTVGTNITFTSAASGGSGSYVYYFIWRDPATGAWSVGQTYSTTPTWTWNTTGLAAGVYTVQVWAKNAGSTAGFETYKSISYTLNPGLGVTVTPLSPQPAGTNVTFNASAIGGSGTFLYQFMWFNPSTGTWTTGKAYSTSSSWVWKTTGLGAAAYQIQVWMKRSGSTAVYDTYKSLRYVLN